MRIACVQFDPQAHDVIGNITKVNALLDKANPQDLDLLVLPELAFCGYENVRDFEVAKTGPTALWAIGKARDYKCVVFAGYAEKDEEEIDSPVYYNSAVVVNRDGQLIGNYRKAFLHDIKDKWASPGLEFFHKFIPTLGQVSMGISMDLNPKGLKAPKIAHELAYETLAYQSQLLILPMSWWAGAEINREVASDPLSCWASRLAPLLHCNRGDNITCVIANRVGMEGGCLYVGTSAVVKLGDRSMRVYGELGSAEDILVVDTQDKGQLICLSGGENMSGSATPLSDEEETEPDQAAEWKVVEG